MTPAVSVKSRIAGTLASPASVSAPSAAAARAWPAPVTDSSRWRGKRSASTPAGTPTKTSEIDRMAIASPTRNGEFVSSSVSQPSTTFSPIIPTELSATAIPRRRKSAMRRSVRDGMTMACGGRAPTMVLARRHPVKPGARPGLPLERLACAPGAAPAMLTASGPTFAGGIEMAHRRSTVSPFTAVLSALVVLACVSPAAAAQDGTMTIGVHVTLVSRWLDPAETEGLITPFVVLYPVHDALVKPMPGGLNTPSLAESWSVSKDGMTYEFVIRKGVRFHNGDPVTADDVKFTFERYRGSGSKLLKEKVKEVQIAAPNRVRFVLKEPWPDFMATYGTSATGAAWIVPKKYIEKVGDDGFKKVPIGAGPFKFVSFQPGVELVLEAFSGYWRKAPSVKRLVMR